MMHEALIFADDRPMSTSDDLYQWATDAETLIRQQHASLADAQAEIARLRGALEACQRYALEFPDSLLRDNLLDTAADALK